MEAAACDAKGADGLGITAQRSPLPPPRPRPRTIAYVTHPLVALQNFAQHVAQHAMKPIRCLVTDALCDALGLFDDDDDDEPQPQQPAPSDPGAPLSAPRSLPPEPVSSQSSIVVVVKAEPPSADDDGEGHHRGGGGDRVAVKPVGEGGPQVTSTTSTGAGKSRRCVIRPFVPPLLTVSDLMVFHEPAYLRCLTEYSKHTWDKLPLPSTPPPAAPFSADCPLMDGLIEYSLAVASGSVAAAVLLNRRAVEAAIHWGGGMHHAQAGECAGFCYVNDCVLAILKLLEVHSRVLYVDLDVHHGDGVEAAFYTTDRVVTLSLHKFAEGFFPGTGFTTDIGVEAGRYCSFNVPLLDGVDDSHYVPLFESCYDAIVAAFEPNAIVLQCGADSLAGDRVGPFNLSSAGHAACVRHVVHTALPTLYLGGGGYTVRNVARLWAAETCVIAGRTVAPEVPSETELRRQGKQETADALYEFFLPTGEAMLVCAEQVPLHPPPPSTDWLRLCGDAIGMVKEQCELLRRQRLRRQLALPK